MAKISTDVDIDVYGRENILAGLKHVVARINRENGKHEKHNTGVYFQNIPCDPFTGIANIGHKESPNYGYFKIDFLNVNMYEGVRDEEHLLSLLNTEPPWDFFEYPEVTDQLFHLKGHSNLLIKYKPKSVEDLAIILAIMRPGKAYLQRYDWETIKEEVWVKIPGDESYQFKRSHAISYSLAIIINLNLIIEQLTSQD